MDAFYFIWDFFFGTLIRTYNYFVTWFENATEHGFRISQSAIITQSLISLLFCGSAFTAMTFAELKNRNRWVHFAIGLLVPVIYPAVLYFAIPKIGAKEEDEEDEEEEEHEKATLPDSEFRSYSKGKGGSAEVLSDDAIMDQNYFNKISKDEEGNLLGPFVLELSADGQILEVEHIVEALPNAVSVQLGHGAGGKKIRLPYDKIKDCKTKAHWLEESQHQAFEEEEDEIYEEDDYYDDEGEE